MPLQYATVLFLAALTGSVLHIFTGRGQGPALKLLLAFSAAYLLGLTFLHLLPELFESGLPHAGWFVIAGFMLQVILDFFSHGVEHGHAHIHPGQGMRYLFTIMAALWIHAFLEGMPFGSPAQDLSHAGHGHAHAHAHSHDHRDSLLLGISIHKVTESLVFTSLLVASGMSRLRTVIWVVVFALMAPAGAMIQYILSGTAAEWAVALGPAVIGLLVGILLHVSTTILFESESGHRFNLMKFLAILAGIALSAIFA